VPPQLGLPAAEVLPAAAALHRVAGCAVGRSCSRNVHRSHRSFFIVRIFALAALVVIVAIAAPTTPPSTASTTAKPHL